MTRGSFWRSKGDFKILGVYEFPILLPGSRLAYQLMLKAHEEDHKSTKITLQRSRSKVWVIKGKVLADKVEKDCIKCRVRKAVKATLSLVTANQLLLGRTSTSTPGAQMFKYVARHKNLQVGDVCLIKYDNKVSATYRLCIVKKVFLSNGGVVRTV